MIMAVIGWMANGGPDMSVHKPGQTFNYASQDFRQNWVSGAQQQGQRSGHGVALRGWNSDAKRQGNVSSSWSGEPGSTRGTYPLGRPSDAFRQKFSKWGDAGPQGNTGWQSTLTQAPPSQSTSAPTQKFDQEVFQTRETRNASGLQPFKVLGQHTQTSRLNPNLAYMYKEKNTQLGAVRRTVTRFF